MAVTIGVELPARSSRSSRSYWLLALPVGRCSIGYYANARSNRRSGPWRRILVERPVRRARDRPSPLALLLLGIKALFFYADNGYRDFTGQGGSSPAPAGADCVYQRYLDAGRGPDLDGDRA